MKIVSKLLCSIWAITLLVMLNVASPVGASGMSVSPIVYGEQMQVSIAYDGASSSTFAYDSAYAHAANEKANRTRRTGGAFDHFAELLAAKSGPVVIGETMTRVEAAAAKYPGAKILNDMPDFRAMGMNPDQVTSAMMQYNRKWILEQMRSGRQIIDIGADVNRARPSIFYEMEQNMLKNYQKLHPEFNGVTHP